MKKVFSIILISILMLMGCERNDVEEYPVPLHQPVDTALKVELYDHISGGYSGLLLLTLEGDEAIDFCKELQELYTFKKFTPATSNSYLSCKIYYQNGDIDIIGSDGCFVLSEHVYEGPNQSVDGYYNVPRELLRKLFSEYVHPNQLPETNEYYVKEK